MIFYHYVLYNRVNYSSICIAIKNKLNLLFIIKNNFKTRILNNLDVSFSLLYV